MHPLFLGRVDDRLDRQVVVQRLAAAAVDVADRGADLGVGVGVDVLLRGSRSAGRRAGGRPGPAGRGPVGAAEKSGSTRAAKSGSVRVRQNAWRASQKSIQESNLAIECESVGSENTHPRRAHHCRAGARAMRGDMVERPSLTSADSRENGQTVLLEPATVNLTTIDVRAGAMSQLPLHWPRIAMLSHP